MQRNVKWILRSQAKSMPRKLPSARDWPRSQARRAGRTAALEGQGWDGLLRRCTRLATKISGMSPLESPLHHEPGEDVSQKKLSSRAVLKPGKPVKQRKHVNMDSGMLLK